MSLLNDTQIAELLTQGKLVKHGKAENIRQCAYPFHAGKIFFGGASSPAIDWTSEGSTSSFNIPPGALVWVRMKETIVLPNNVSALWWQTHKLSKFGIMLINTSIVDPGYQGFVTGLFINFGRSPVSIYPDTVMARLMFFQVNADIAKPYVNSSTDDEYDSEINNLANAGPASFLMVGEMTARVINEREDALRSLITERTKIVNEFETQKTAIVSALSDEKRKIVSELKADAPTYFRRSFAWAGAGFAILVAVTIFVPWIQEWTRPDLDDYVAKSVDKRLLSNFEVPANVLPEGVILNKRIDDLNTKIDELEKHDQKRESEKANTSGGPNATP
jgi:deoxycytidine triphosphate deaminase